MAKTLAEIGNEVVEAGDDMPEVDLSPAKAKAAAKEITDRNAADMAKYNKHIIKAKAEGRKPMGEEAFFDELKAEAEEAKAFKKEMKS